MTRAAVLIVPLLLAACGGESTTDSAARTGEVSLRNASMGEVAEQTAAAAKAGAMRFQPGEWETSVEVLDAAIPGIPAEAAREMQKQMQARTTTRSCMTREQAERPSEDMFAGDRGECRFERYQMQDGRIDAAMICAAGSGDEAGSARITMAGSYSATSFELRNSVETQPAGGVPAVTVDTRVTGRRLGDCAT